MGSTMLKSALAALVLALAGASWTEECSRHCMHDNNHMKREMLTKSCETYRYVLPRPKMFSKCKRAFDRAMQTGCAEACTGEKNFGHTVGHDASNECKGERNEVPRPGAFEACKAGYFGGAQCVSDFVKHLQEKHKAGMDDSAAEDTSAADTAKEEAAAAKAQAQAATEAAEKAKAVEAAEAAQAQAKAQAEAAQAKAAEAAKAAEEKKDAELEAARAAARAAYSQASEEEEAKGEEAEAEAAPDKDGNLRGEGDEVAAE